MEIKDCNCGGEGKLFIHTLPDKNKDIYYKIYCKSCGINTPSSKSLSEVLEVWNNVMKRKVSLVPYSIETNQTNIFPSGSCTYVLDRMKKGLS